MGWLLRRGIRVTTRGPPPGPVSGSSGGQGGGLGGNGSRGQGPHDRSGRGAGPSEDEDDDWGSVWPPVAGEVLYCSASQLGGQPQPEVVDLFSNGSPRRTEDDQNAAAPGAPLT